MVLSRRPRLILVARDFHGRTESAFEFLIENGLPVKLIRVSVYEDLQDRRFVDVRESTNQSLLLPKKIALSRTIQGLAAVEFGLRTCLMQGCFKRAMHLFGSVHD